MTLRTQVSEMQVVVAAKAQVVAQAKADCEELLVAIVQVQLQGPLWWRWWWRRWWWWSLMRGAALPACTACTWLDPQYAGVSSLNSKVGCVLHARLSCPPRSAAQPVCDAPPGQARGG